MSGCDGHLTTEQLAAIVGALVVLANALSGYLVVLARRRDDAKPDHND